MRSGSRKIGWTFLTNHAMVLISVWRSPGLPVREIAARVRITERATYRILAELVAAGYLSRRRVGRNNFYLVHDDRRLRHPGFSQHGIEKLLKALETAKS